jgi:ketosteroid isomerase-like protein
MLDESERENAAAAMRQVNRAWLEGRVQDLASMVHPEIVMVFPGFGGRTQGRENFLAGFDEFSRNATIQEFRKHGHQVDVAGETAVVTFRYDMIYDRSGERYSSAGRDLWVFQKQGSGWIAVWRTMLEMENSSRPA